MITGSNWEFLPILYLDVLRLIWIVDFSGNSGIIIIVKGRWKPRYARRADESNNSEKISKKMRPLDKNLLFRGGVVTSSTVPSFSKSLFRRETSNSSH